MPEQKIILASSSPQRKLLMENLNVPFEVCPADIDEKAIRDEDLKVRAEKIARSKAEKVFSERGGIIIAADMFFDFNGHVMEKPKDIDEARQMLRVLSGNKFSGYTGFCYIDKQNNIDFSTTVITNSALRTLSEVEIDEYVRKFPVTTWAGAFSAAYPYGQTMVAEINGSPTALTYGIPIELVVEYLRKSGFEIHP